MRQHRPTKSSSCQQEKLKGLKTLAFPGINWISKSLLSSIMGIVNFLLAWIRLGKNEALAQINSDTLTNAQ